MKLELRHLAPYLPYDLKIQVYGQNSFEDYISIMERLSNDSEMYLGLEWHNIDNPQYLKPILRPISDFTKEEFKEELYQYYRTLGIDVKMVNYDSGNDNSFDMTLTVTYKLMDDIFTDILINRGSTSETPYHIFVWLCENHFDVFGLIEKGLTIDLNTIEQ